MSLQADWGFDPLDLDLSLNVGILTREGSNLIIGPPRDFFMESYVTKWGKLKKMVYLRLRYWLLTITCVVRND